MKKAKKFLTMLLTVAMVIGSLGVVMAVEDELDVTPSCSANCDVWCNRNSSSASTHLYLDRSYDSASAYVSITVTGGRELSYRVLGSDSSSASFDSDLRAMADVEVVYAEVPYKAVSTHDASVELSSPSPLTLTAYYD